MIRGGSRIDWILAIRKAIVVNVAMSSCHTTGAAIGVKVLHRAVKLSEFVLRRRFLFLRLEVVVEAPRQLNEYDHHISIQVAHDDPVGVGLTFFPTGFLEIVGLESAIVVDDQSLARSLVPDLDDGPPLLGLVVLGTGRDAIGQSLHYPDTGGRCALIRLNSPDNASPTLPSSVSSMKACLRSTRSRGISPGCSA